MHISTVLVMKLESFSLFTVDKSVCMRHQFSFRMIRSKRALKSVMISDGFRHAAWRSETLQPGTEGQLVFRSVWVWEWEFAFNDLL